MDKKTSAICLRYAKKGDPRPSVSNLACLIVKFSLVLSQVERKLRSGARRSEFFSILLLRVGEVRRASINSAFRQSWKLLKDCYGHARWSLALGVQYFVNDPLSAIDKAGYLPPVPSADNARAFGQV